MKINIKYSRRRNLKKCEERSEDRGRGRRPVKTGGKENQKRRPARNTAREDEIAKERNSRRWLAGSVLVRVQL
ncbi:hypothetical protein ACOSQ3_018010 [Xanthoceras sorbifolium]